ncbi:hypothetical protein ACH4FX_37305 [Streptomyces sp. NPDC018019]|uniref:hypothetical protein n=1 Tax=Streptomyces sp. NPDC018019 TaxID=3365030 RepID=UPI0037AF2D35
MADVQEIRRQMQAIQAAREEAFGPLLNLLEQRDHLKQQLAALDEPYAQAFVAAEAAGWAKEDLLALGAEEPAKRPKGRPRARGTATKKKATGTTAQVPTQNAAGDAATPTENASA